MKAERLSICFTAMSLALAAMTCLSQSAGVARAGTLNIIERDSLGVNSLFAGSGGAVDTRDMSHSSAAPTGNFDFSDGGTVQVLDSDPFSTGTASATGIISAMDNVEQPTPATINITSSATAEGTALVVSGPSNANSRQRARTRVRFQVIGDDATFQLTGNFTTPANSQFIGDVVRLELRRPFTANKKFDINTSGPVNEFGTLTAGQTWEFIVDINDKSAASAGLPSDADLFSYDLTFSVVSLVPEPSTLLIALLGITPVALRRRRKRRSS